MFWRIPQHSLYEDNSMHELSESRSLLVGTATLKITYIARMSRNHSTSRHLTGRLRSRTSIRSKTYIWEHR